MGKDISLIMEFKKNGVWQPLGKKTSYGFEPQESVLESTNFIGLVFCREHLCGWYEDEKVPYVHENRNGSPTDVSNETKTYLAEGFWNVHGFITKSDIENFNWDFEIPFNVAVSSKDKEEYLRTGKRPSTWSTSGTNKVRLQFGIPFREFHKDWFEELKVLESLGEDYRYLYYFE